MNFGAQVGKEDWIEGKGKGGDLEEGEWYVNTELPVVDRDYNVQPQDVIAAV